MRFLGTGAAELYPNPFCDCEACSQARTSDDPRMLRRRSSLLLDAKTLIDPNPDTPFACIAGGISLSGVENIFVTHLHGDHFSFSTLECLSMCVTPPPHPTVWVSPAAFRGLEKLHDFLSDQLKITQPDLFSMVPFRKMEPFTQYSIGDMQVSAVYGNHVGLFPDEHSLNYLFEKKGKRLLYALDTGIPREEAFDYLADTKLDILVIDATFGERPVEDTNGHLNQKNLLRTLERFQRTGTVTEQTWIYLTHFSHKGGRPHVQFEDEMRSLWGPQVTVAYDGLHVDWPVAASLP